MTKYRHIRRGRIAVSTIIFMLLTATIADGTVGVSPLGRMLQNTQIVPAILGGTVVWLVLWVILTLTFGRAYCSTVCPVGYLFDVGGYLGHRAWWGRQRRYRYAPAINMLRYSIPTGVAVCLFAGLTWIVQASDPYAVYYKIVYNISHVGIISFGSLTIAILALACIIALGFGRGRLACNTVCPAGGLLGLLGRQPVYRIDINTDLCIHCGKCEDVCKSSCIDLRDCVVDNSRCVMCMNCTAVCPNDAITVRRGQHRLSTPLMTRV